MRLFWSVAEFVEYDSSETLNYPPRNIVSPAFLSLVTHLLCRFEKISFRVGENLCSALETQFFNATNSLTCRQRIGRSVLT